MAQMQRRLAHEKQKGAFDLDQLSDRRGLLQPTTQVQDSRCSDCDRCVAPAATLPDMENLLKSGWTHLTTVEADQSSVVVTTIPKRGSTYGLGYPASGCFWEGRSDRDGGNGGRRVSRSRAGQRFISDVISDGPEKPYPAAFSLAAVRRAPRTYQ
jgi:hypothetical protein